jgi:hypothetical protein
LQGFPFFYQVFTSHSKFIEKNGRSGMLRTATIKIKI